MRNRLFGLKNIFRLFFSENWKEFMLVVIAAILIAYFLSNDLAKLFTADGWMKTMMKIN